jgi:hypothetical protein
MLGLDTSGVFGKGAILPEILEHPVHFDDRFVTQ